MYKYIYLLSTDLECLRKDNDGWRLVLNVITVKTDITDITDNDAGQLTDVTWVT